MSGTKEGGSRVICILVTSSPESENTRTLFKITEAAIAMGHQVQIFLMSDGVYHILCQSLSTLIAKGAEVALCTYDAMERGLDKKTGIYFGSYYDLAVMVAKADGFLALT
ncbi:MAG: DsrE family protein [bacterium]